jgi:CheY-like chemotaxis protein
MAPDPAVGPVLIVDDDPDGRETLIQFLGHHGYTIAAVANGYDALALARKLKPRVAIIDLGLPDVTGFELIRMLKAETATAHIPVIVLSGHVFPKHREQAAQAGSEVFLAKPVEPDDLLAAVRNLIG